MTGEIIAEAAQRAWRVHWPNRFATPSGFDTWPVEELERRERASRIRPGAPFMTGPDGRADGAVTRFLNSSRFHRFRLATKRSFMYDYRLLFDWLYVNGVHWSRATDEDLEDYADFRRSDSDSPRRIGGSKWNRELWAFFHLYSWAVEEGYVLKNPVRGETWTSADGRSHVRLDLMARDVVSTDVKWLTPRMWDRWRDVGLLGLDASGLPEDSFRGRNTDRNAAFADLLFDSGLRCTEGATLLVFELPEPPFYGNYIRLRVATEVAKHKSGRPFWVTSPTMSKLRSYLLISRDQIVRKAQRSGLYEAIPDRLEVVRFDLLPKPTLTWFEPATKKTSVVRIDSIGIEDRYRLYVRDEQGLSPAALFLAEDGTPFRSHSWEWVFTQANIRTTRLLGNHAPFATPHMARHSFALYTLLALVHIQDADLGLDAETKARIVAAIPDPWRQVKDLLGHKDVATTRDVYLAPVSEVQLRQIFDGRNVTVSLLLQALARESPLVQDFADDEG